MSMPGLETMLVEGSGTGALGLLVAVLLGLRHATDPDHLTAVSTLVLSEERDGARKAGDLGRRLRFPATAARYEGRNCDEGRELHGP